jgi:cytochrome c oxidase subunit 2
MAAMLASGVQAQAPTARSVRMSAERFLFTPSEVTVAPGTEIEFHLSSEDTAHGFRILGHPVETVIPKRGRGETTVRFKPPGPGTYVFECSRMCGAGHSFMRGTIVVREPSGRRSP